MTERVIDSYLFQALREMRAGRLVSDDANETDFKHVAQEETNPLIRLLQKQITWENKQDATIKVYDEPDLHRKFEAILAICQLKKIDITVIVRFKLTPKHVSFENYIIRFEENSDTKAYQHYNRFQMHKFSQAEAFDATPEGRRFKFCVIEGSKLSPST